MISYIDALKKCSNVHDLAVLLGYKKASNLTYVLHGIPSELRYREFEVNKSGGGTRVIRAPQGYLKALQRALSKYLAKCLAEIEEKNPKRKNISHGFIAGRSIATNANRHKNKRYIFNVDLKDYFPSITYSRVKNFFIKNRDFKLNEAVAKTIAQICCFNNQLPQGSPTSPVVSNLITHVLDVHLLRMAKEFGCTYTRYADDITFSTNAKEFPTGLAIKVRGAWISASGLNKTVEFCGFQINPAKTRMTHEFKRQTVTGLVVNSRVSGGVHLYRSVRSMVNQLYSGGGYYIKYKENSDKHKEEGALKRIANYIIDLFFGNRGNDINEVFTMESGSLSKLDGLINHIISIDIANSKMNKLREIESKYREKTNGKKKFDLSDMNVDVFLSEGKAKFYYRYAFFKYFKMNNIPIIIPEGKTDISYLKYAIKSRHKKFPSLYASEKGGYAIGFLNPKSRAANILALRGGTEHFNDLIKSYDKTYKSYRFDGLNNPVIILVDNDSGGKRCYQNVSKLSNNIIEIESNLDYYHLGNNLYFITTPPINKGPSCMEDFFEKAVKEELIDGKSLSLDNDYSKSTHYGKADFVEKIVAPKWRELDFSGFDELLRRISEAVKHHSSIQKKSTK